MNCTACNIKSCRITEACNAQKIDTETILEKYHEAENQAIVQSAAELVDNGRAGSLSRLDEIIEFAKLQGYKKLGLAYCYGMEPEAAVAAKIIRDAGVPVSAVSCTVGAMAQNAVNDKSDLQGVSCNPISQAEQMNVEGVDLAVTMGLCLGHDILFQKTVNADVVPFVVKDRVFDHNPLQAVKQRKVQQRQNK